MLRLLYGVEDFRNLGLVETNFTVRQDDARNLSRPGEPLSTATGVTEKSIKFPRS